MIAAWVILAVGLSYVGILFGVAFFGDRRAEQGRSLIASPYVYAFSMAVYCTAWTFYGSVGRAASSGIGFLPIYLGPTLAASLSWLILRKIVRISKQERITSIADFLASRFGKSRALGGVVTGIAVVGIVPYISLQLKAVSMSFLLLVRGVGEGGGGDLGHDPIFARTALGSAILLAVFAILFGTRHLDLTEHHEGLVLAIAFESVVKLIAFLAIGAWVCFGLYGGLDTLFDRVLARPELAAMTTFQGPWGAWSWMLLLSFSAILFLPRQFQVAVVENVDERHLRKAAWLFPLYLLAINLFVLPVAFAGRLQFPSGTVDGDAFVLGLPLAAGHHAMALLVFVGGLSASTGMVIVETVALSTMISNDLVLPLLLRSALGGPDPNLGVRILMVRRLAIVGILALGQGYLLATGAAGSLVSIGLISFAAVAQLAPAMFAGLFWRGATRRGALAGLLGGFVVWAYTLPLPSYVSGGGARHLVPRRRAVRAVLAAAPRAVRGGDVRPRRPLAVLEPAGQRRRAHRGVVAGRPVGGRVRPGAALRRRLPPPPGEPRAAALAGRHAGGRGALPARAVSRPGAHPRRAGRLLRGAAPGPRPDGLRRRRAGGLRRAPARRHHRHRLGPRRPRPRSPRSRSWGWARSCTCSTRPRG